MLGHGWWADVLQLTSCPAVAELPDNDNDNDNNNDDDDDDNDDDDDDDDDDNDDDGHSSSHWCIGYSLGRIW